ncbi:MAG: anti-sigma factor antagonist [bacterium]|nr:anti-sigma factor antagonist [bacterium]
MAERGPMELDVSDDGAVVVVRISGPVSAAHSPELRTIISGSFQKGKSVIVDLGGCEYMDSSGLATLVEGVQLAEHNKKSFLVTGEFDDKVKHLFEITRLDELFEEFHYATIDEAKSQLV